MWNNNKGEWSELYVFCQILFSGVLYAADKDLHKIEEVHFPVLRVIREEDVGRPIDYYSGETIRIYAGKTLMKEIDKEEFRLVAQELLQEIPKGGRAFGIPSVEDFFASVYCTKVKAASNKKQDITLQLHDIYTGIKPVCGFSVKSYLGANPTLINPGENTNVDYEIDGCNDVIMDAVNSIRTRTKLIDRMDALNKAGCTFLLPEHLISSRFEENLQFIDTIMPTFIMYMVLYKFLYFLNRTTEIIDKMKEENPLGFSNVEMYTYKFKKLLAAWALGLTPERTDWMGTEDANGGYITVKKDGTVVCYYLYNRMEFEQYLFDYTYFDKPSSTKYKYCTVYKEGGKYKIKLCLQVRFR